jgi:threonine dehydrogenase-like Zn-dependent dehydrogenase
MLPEAAAAADPRRALRSTRPLLQALRLGATLATMHGLFLERGTLRLRDDLPEPLSRSGWTTVQVRRAGICATDQALARGYMDFSGVPGHEFVGVALDGPFEGRRVVGEINAGCGVCARCLGGDSRHCGARTVLGILGLPGAFAERIVLPDVNLLPVPDEVDDDTATLTEPLAAALHIADDVPFERGERVLVVGDGKLGLLCALALRSRGAEVTLAGRHAERAKWLPAGIVHVTGWFDGDGPPRVAPFSLVVEASGNADVLPRLLSLVAPRGTIVLKTTTERPTMLDLAALVVAEQRLIGSRCGRFAPALDALARGDVDVRPLITARYSLLDGVAAFQHAGSRGVLKVLIDASPRA